MFRYKQRYHVGRISSENRWVFRIVDTSYTPAKYYIELVPNRSRVILVPIILRIIRPRSIIWSDQWSAYNALMTLGFQHYTVNHRINFFNPENNVHTQNIESLWNKLKKRIIKQHGCDYETLPLNLKMWIWKDNICKNDFSKVIEILRY
ncbi:hypothetical protein DMUE_2100 [Dictyocoela muelleri]|nr:hypothetical protein DMUE_2100 [Dictyocoela muelleri]